MFMVRVFILTLPYNVCIAQSTGAIARLFPSPSGEGRVRGLSLRGAQRRGNLLCTPSSGRLIYVGMQLASMTATRAGKAAFRTCPEPESVSGSGLGASLSGQHPHQLVGAQPQRD